MKFESSRKSAPPVSASVAIRSGIAPDGGLYLPDHMPLLDPSRLGPDLDLAELAAELLAPFFAGDPLGDELGAICRQALDFPAPVVSPDGDRRHVLELFHGPTGAFKDFGARFLMACFERIGRGGAPIHVLAATSGDTGGAVGCAAEGRSNVAATILFPKGRVSPFQRLQLSCWGAPVTSLEVDGDFDDCQRLVKAAFADPKLCGPHRLSSANSINLARLLPQMVAIAAAALKIWSATGTAPGFIIPTGNLGHAVAALWARRLGLPIGPIHAVTNANPTLHEWHEGQDYRPRPSLATIANAMDVGAPSNFERLIAMDEKDRALRVQRVDDAAIRRRIRLEHQRTAYVFCPHSATAAEAHARLGKEERGARDWVLVATAHPYKFAEVVEPLIGEVLAPPPALKAILGRTVKVRPIVASLDSLAEALGEPPRFDQAA